MLFDFHIKLISLPHANVIHHPSQTKRCEARFSVYVITGSSDQTKQGHHLHRRQAIEQPSIQDSTPSLLHCVPDVDILFPQEQRQRPTTTSGTIISSGKYSHNNIVGYATSLQTSNGTAESNASRQSCHSYLSV